MVQMFAEFAREACWQVKTKNYVLVNEQGTFE